VHVAKSDKKGFYYVRILPELAGAVAEGFVIGNHSFSHNRFSDMPLQLCRKEIAVTRRRLLEIYQKAGVAPPAFLFRFPYLDKGASWQRRVFQFALRAHDDEQGQWREGGGKQRQHHGIH